MNLISHDAAQTMRYYKQLHSGMRGGTHIHKAVICGISNTVFIAHAADLSKQSTALGSDLATSSQQNVLKVCIGENAG
jgi:hypothetical protein